VTVGEALSDARHAAGLSVDDVAARTRIRPHVIQAIEQDDLAPCGGDAYARGHVRTLARTLGADPEEMVGMLGSTAPPAPVVPATKDGMDLEGDLGKPRFSLDWTGVLAVAVVLMLGFTGYVLVRDLGGAKEAQSAHRPVVRAVATPKPTPTRTAVAAPTSGVRVVVAATNGPSWIRARNAAGKTLYEGTIGKGEQREFADRRRVRLVVGDSGVVTLTVNGHKMPTLGAPGQVRTVAYGPQGQV